MSTTFRGKHIQLVDIAAVPPSVAKQLDAFSFLPIPGSIVIRDHGAFLRCPSNHADDIPWIRLVKVKVEGKNVVTVFDWINGYGIKTGEKLGQML